LRERGRGLFEGNIRRLAWWGRGKQQSLGTPDSPDISIEKAGRCSILTVKTFRNIVNCVMRKKNELPPRNPSW